MAETNDKLLPLEVVYKATTTEVLQTKMSARTCNVFLYATTVIVNLIAFAAGIAFAWTSPVLPKLKNLENISNNPIGRLITSNEESWIAGCLSLGGTVGPLVSGYLSNRIGRKKTLLLVACPMLVSYLITAFAQTVPLLYLTRLTMGVGAGSVFTVLPLYLAEIGEDHNRGTLGCLMGAFIAAGLLFSYAVGPFFSIQTFCLLCAIPLIVFIPVFLIWFPESPQYLALTKKYQELEISLLKLRNTTAREIQKEIQDITRTIENNNEKGSIVDLFKSKAARKGLIITVGLVILQQFAGINAVLSYMQLIFDAAGSGLSPEISTIFVGLIQLGAVLVTSSIVDRLGRKILLLLSTLGSCIALISLGTYFYLKTNGFSVASISWLPISSLLVFVVAFNIGLGPLPWTVMAELFPANIKSIAATLVTFICFFACFLITLFFPSLSLVLGMAKSFWAFATVCIFGQLFIYVLLPETKGKSFQTIQSELEGNRQ